MNSFENETWLIEIGDEVIVKKAEQGREALTDIERLIYCIWVADYSLRNAGDLLTADDLYAPYRDEGAQLAQALGLPIVKAIFDMPPEELEEGYFDLFDDICAELRSRQKG
ncbi:hypothetical protein L7H23_03160 [Sphingopyxis sp. BSN-002]|uniref:hypothetical protein n=1 Tax=Sphingopyxis sp. BSN-002 TaxID=2911495 RepID=UPI001EDB60CC|nr:hypothetical protein [Sphingopyxis sp. BSN-002]UKK85124.1 hypothetical protein L7H23_03160 [Sphingopyxis sp. BSN-002]